MGVNIQVRRKQVANGRKEIHVSTPFDVRYGFWGVVSEVHPEDCTVHIRMDNGQIITGVRVASMEWVTVVTDKPLTGERHLPPVDTYVFCMMPNGEVSSAFVLCSGFTKQSLHADFKIEGDDAKNTHEKVENSGWKNTTDYRTGTKTISNKVEDETISIVVDQETEGEESVIITIHENEFLINKDGIDIKTAGVINITCEKDAGVNVTGNANLKIDQDAIIEANNISIKAAVKTEIKGGQVVLGGAVIPTGKGALCALPACTFTGAPHVGDTTNGA